MTWLVTGGAGYIGSHVVRAFEAEGIPAVVIDDLSSGHRDFVRPEVPFYAGSVLERELLDQIFAEQQIAGVVHLAAERLGEPAATHLHPERHWHGDSAGVDGRP